MAPLINLVILLYDTSDGGVVAKGVNSQTKGSGFNPEPTFVAILELDALKPALLLNEINLNPLEVDSGLKCQLSDYISLQ